MSSQGVMFSKQDSNNPGLCPIKDNNRALVATSGPEINSLACLCVLQGPRHNTRCCFSIQLFIFLIIFCLETPKKGSGPVAYPGIFFGGVQQIQLRTEDRERGSAGGSPLVRGSGGSCNLVKEISFHIVNFS
jgi:hypothetical protein